MIPKSGNRFSNKITRKVNRGSSWQNKSFRCFSG